MEAMRSIDARRNHLDRLCSPLEMAKRLAVPWYRFPLLIQICLLIQPRKREQLITQIVETIIGTWVGMVIRHDIHEHAEQEAECKACIEQGTLVYRACCQFPPVARGSRVRIHMSLLTQAW